jgi:hypothetical protein
MPRVNLSEAGRKHSYREYVFPFGTPPRHSYRIGGVDYISAEQDIRQRDSYIAGEVSPSRAYGPPLVVVIPDGEGRTNQVQYNWIQGIRYNTGPSTIVSRRYGLPSSPSDTKVVVWTGSFEFRISQSKRNDVSFWACSFKATRGVTERDGLSQLDCSLRCWK